MSKVFSFLFKAKAKYYTAVVIIAILAVSYFGFEKVTVEVETYTVAQGEFVISVITMGELIARESRAIVAPSNVSGQMQIVDMAPEGERVKAGDFLLQFDTANLENKLAQEQDELVNLQLQLEERIEQNKIDLEQREAQLEVQRLDYERSQLEYQLMDYEPAIKRRQQEINMKKADLNMVKAISDLEKFKDQQKNNLRRTEDRIKRQFREIEETEEELEASTMYAPIAGLVVYKETWQNGNYQKIKIGDNVRRYQQIIDLPDLSVMKVKTVVNEVDFPKIGTGQEVIIELDANDITYYGTITDISRLARSEGGAGSVKVFDVEVTIKNGDETLKPGMSATCQIIAEKIDNAIFVPLQSVFEEAGNTFVFLGDGFQKVEVKTGKRNPNYVVIVEGLEPGTKVTLRDPFMQLEAIGTDIKERPPAGSGAVGNAAAAPMRIDINMMREMRGRGMDIRH